MTQPKRNMRIEKVRELFAQWPDYYIIGNKPYEKGCILFKRWKRGENPQAVHRTDANWQMYELGMTKGWHPDQLLLRNPDEPESNGDELFTEPRNHRRNTLKVLNHHIDSLREVQELIPIFGPVGASLEETIGNLERLRRNYR